MAVVVQRPLKGSRISTFYPIKTLPPLSSLDSAFQLQEYISLLIRLDIHDVDAIVSIPDRAGERDSHSDNNEASKGEEREGEKDGRGDFAVDESCWIYGQLRRLAQDLSHPLITMLQQECIRATCPEMKAGEWLYLCVAHGNDGAMEQCCAIDYILHTVDSATALLNSPRAFPSRLSITAPSHRHFSSLARRLGRIFAHAYFHHREVFEQAEAESSLYVRFLALTSRFDLVPPEFLVIPPRILHDDHPNDVEPPRLHAAAVDPQLAREQQDGRRQGLGSQFEQGGLGQGPPPGAAERNPSPRKGRSRTDTMVFSEAYNMAEELAKGEEPEPEIETREIEEPASSKTTREQDPLPEFRNSPGPEPEEHVTEQHPLESQVEHSVGEASAPEATSEPEHDEFSSVDPALARESEEDLLQVEPAEPEPSVEDSHSPDVTEEEREEAHVESLTQPTEKEEEEEEEHDVTEEISLLEPAEDQHEQQILTAPTASSDMTSIPEDEGHKDSGVAEASNDAEATVAAVKSAPEEIQDKEGEGEGEPSEVEEREPNEATGENEKQVDVTKGAAEEPEVDAEGAKRDEPSDPAVDVEAGTS